MPLRTRQLVTLAAVLVAAAAIWLVGRPLSEVQQQRRHFAELQRQVAAARESRAARSADRGRVMRLRAQARTANEAQRTAFDAEATQIESRIGWGDRDTVRKAVAAAPLVTVWRSTPLPDFPEVSIERGNGCLSCHVSVAAPGYEQYPAPFRTHPSFANYVGAASPHPPSRVACTSCHRGNEFGTTFAEARHARASDDERGGTIGSREWSSPSISGAMLPAARVEAGCVTCHLGERYQPGAIALNDALLTFERAGCYACHVAPGLEGAPKRGPDLRRIKGKLTPEWVRRWLADPRAIKPATWMPAFWRGTAALTSDERAGIDAVVAYLFANGDDYAPAVLTPPHGDAARGHQIVEAVGCLGCHVVGDARRDATSLHRTFGQPLEGIGGKTTYAWLFDWLRDPSRYSPHARMPNLRLTPAEAADAASYLQTLGQAPTSAAAPPFTDDEPYRKILRTYDPSAASTTDATGDALRVATGRAVIDALGCFNCHEIRGFEGRTTTVKMREMPDFDAGAIAALFGSAEQGKTPSSAEVLKRHPGPDYSFAPNEMKRLALALTAVSAPKANMHALTTPWHMAKVKGRSLAQERNCVGCHVIDGVGGDFVKLVAEPTLGPPLLTPEGTRVQPAWLRGFLRQPSTIRPWLSVRMPTFGLSDDDIEVVGSYFRGIAPENPKPTPLPAGVTVEAGKELFELLKCQQCHVLGSIPKDQPTSNLAPDLRMTRDRLQPDWILAWLQNPSAILPGTRMPTFWPDYPKSFYPPLDRDGAKQIRAIREHLLTLR